MRQLIDFPYKNILVLGLAKSGTAAATLLLNNQLNVRINDMNATEHDDTVLNLKEMGAEVILGSHPLSVLDEMEVVVKNPGIPYENVIVKEAIKRNIPILTEVELAYQLLNNHIIGITGSNGKTTTTTLVTEMLSHSNKPVKIAGNIGTVATEVAQSMKEDEQMVVELSSFQLLGIQTFKPKVAVLLNVYEAHLDYHKTLESYRQAKFNILKNQTKNDYLVYNFDDPVITKGIEDAQAKLVPFSVHEKNLHGGWIDDTFVYFGEEKIISREDIALVGKHNLENILAAISAAKISGATNEGIKHVLTTFTGVNHRLELVGQLHGRTFYNDSKATNILATQKALSAFEQPTVLLAGGLDRGNEFHELLPYLKQVKAMVLFGETAQKLKTLAEEANISNIYINHNMDEAVQMAYDCSSEGDVILLSPACASWDQYKTFEERGDMFKKAVHTLV